MNTKPESAAASSTLDTVKIYAAAAVLLGGLFAYYWFSDVSLLIRVLGLIAALVVAILVALQSTQGRQLWEFVQGSQVEIRKVVWPTQQETLQTTGLVFVFTLVLGLFFLLIDTLLLRLTQYLTGQGA
jgi:preprotein translocase subunit SecE